MRVSRIIPFLILIITFTIPLQSQAITLAELGLTARILVPAVPPSVSLLPAIARAVVSPWTVAVAGAITVAAFEFATNNSGGIGNVRVGSSAAQHEAVPGWNDPNTPPATSSMVYSSQSFAVPDVYYTFSSASALCNHALAYAIARWPTLVPFVLYANTWNGTNGLCVLHDKYGTEGDYGISYTCAAGYSTNGSGGCNLANPSAVLWPSDGIASVDSTGTGWQNNPQEQDNVTVPSGTTLFNNTYYDQFGNKVHEWATANSSGGTDFHQQVEITNTSESSVQEQGVSTNSTGNVTNVWNIAYPNTTISNITNNITTPNVASVQFPSGLMLDTTGQTIHTDIHGVAGGAAHPTNDWLWYLDTDVSSVNTGVQALNTTLGITNTDLAAIQSATSALQTPLQSNVTATQGLHTDLTSLNAGVTSVNTNLGTLNSSVQNVQGKLDTLHADLTQAGTKPTWTDAPTFQASLETFMTAIRSGGLIGAVSSIVIPSSSGTCPTGTTQLFGATQVWDVQCTLWDSVSSLLIPVFLAGWALYGLKVLMSA